MLGSFKVDEQKHRIIEKRILQLDPLSVSPDFCHSIVEKTT